MCMGSQVQKPQTFNVLETNIKHILNVQNNLCFKCFNTTYHYSLWVSALPVLSLCSMLLLSSPPQIFGLFERSCSAPARPQTLKELRGLLNVPPRPHFVCDSISPRVVRLNTEELARGLLPERKAKFIPSHSGTVAFLPIDGVMPKQTTELHYRWNKLPDWQSRLF